jgi:hypothetical protein
VILSWLMFIYFHKAFINNASVLIASLENQLLNNTKISLSKKDGSFLFYHNETNKDNTSDVIPIEPERQNGLLGRDDLFLIVLVDDLNVAYGLRDLNL